MGNILTVDPATGIIRPASKGSPGDTASVIESSLLRAARGLRPPTIMGLGDSHTARGYLDTTDSLTATSAGYFGSGAYNPIAWAHLLSGGKLYLAARPIAATAGYTSTQIVATHLPTVEAAAPGFCNVIAGTNDANAQLSDIATTTANITTICTRLLNVGTIPILNTLPPNRNLTSGAWGQDRLRAWIIRFARDNGLPLVDLYGSAMVDPAGYGTYLGDVGSGTYNSDNVHMNGAGAKVAGGLIWAAVQPYLPASTPALLTHNQRSTAEAAFVKSGNPLMLTDSNSDGVPNNWSVAVGTPTSTALASDAAILGNYFTVTRGASDVQFGYGLGAGQGATAGNRVLVGCRLKTSVKGVGGTFIARWSTVVSGAEKFCCGLVDWTEDLPAGATFAQEFTMPTGSDGSLYFNVYVKGASGAAVSVGQYTVIDLTAAGVA